MDKTFTQRLFLLAIFTLFTFTGVYAQTITVGSVDPSPGWYGRGSTISVPISINDAGGCIDQSNTFNVFLSDASGNFTPGTLIGSFTGFYAPFVNGAIPAGTPAGTGYKVRVQSTSPATTSAASAAFEIKAVTGVTASASSNKNVAAGVFGQCVGAANSPFVISNTSAAGTTVTASFFNTQTQSFEATDVPIPATGYTFNAANTTTYTVIVKTTDASGTVGTFQYQLINNPVHQNIGSAGNNFVCLINNKGDLSFSIDISALSAGGIGANYLGDTYVLDWGDGTSTTFTYCQLKALGGVVTHTFTLPSCGKNPGNGDSNAFFVTNSPVSPYCGQITAAPGVSAKVIIKPTTSFTAPSVACVGTALTIPNTSDPGPDYSLGATSTCVANPGAKYDWILDGVPVPGYQGVFRSVSFIFPATTTHGTHVLELDSELPASGVGCQADPAIQTICFEDPPQPIFSIPSQICITSHVIPTNTSVIDASCGIGTYKWTVAGPGAVTYASGTSSTSALPEFVFPVAGVYTVQLGVNSGGCGLINAPAQTIRVDAAPTASLSPDITICGNSLTLTFDPSQTITKTTFTGTAQTQPTTYTWSVTGPSPVTFTNLTTPNSQYPQILFSNFGTYTVSVTHQNSCGTVTKTQKITFVQAPLVDVGIDQTVCASSPVVHGLHGNITGVYTSLQWTTNGDGSFSAPTSQTTDYTPGPNDINTTGQVTLTLQVTNTGLPVPCNIVSDDLILNITPTAFITSPPTEALCSAQPLAYTITANNSLATFAWTASVTSGTATGFTASGTSANINDVITNTGSTDAVVTYNILPTIGSCPGTPFVLTVTIHPLPVLTIPAPPPVCNNQPANVVLTSNVAGTTYTWTSTADPNITGNTTQATPTAISSLQDILNNSGTTAQTATYVVTPYNGTCPGTPVTTVVTVEPSVKPSIVGADQEICFPTIPFQLPGNDPGPFTGEWTQVDANSAVTFSDKTKFDAKITNVAASNIPYQFQWTITGAPGCPTSSSIFTLKVDNPAVGGTVTPSPADVCSGSGSTLTLTGYANSVVQWESSPDGITNWSVISNATNQYITPALTQTTYYRALVHYGTNCPDVYSSTATVIVHQPPTIADAGPNDEVCNSAFYKLGGNVPTSGTGLWTADINNPAGATFVNATDPKTQVNGLVPGSYTFTWTITASASCPPSAKSVTIKVDPPPIGGTTSSPATVCSGDNSGHITLTGQSGNVVEWQSSVDNGATWQTIANAGTNTTIPYAQLTQTTQYRAGVKNPGLCDEVFSIPTTITVNPIAPIAYAGPDRDICNETTINLHGNDPGTFSGMWTQTKGPPVTFANASDPQTQVSGLARGNVYKFKWTIFGLPPCGNTESTVTIGAYADVIASFTLDQSHGCGPTTVSFTNTSTPSPTGTFVWDFGDGSPAVTAVNPPPHTYAPSTDGTEKEYTITLTPTSNCNLQTPFQRQITISPQVPIAALSPNQASACGTFTLIVHNLSPGVNTKYDFYLKDGNGATVQHLTLNDKSDAVFQPIVPTIAANYTVYLTVTDECGHQATTVPQIISVSPSNLVSQIQIKGGIESVCLGSPVTFQNISSGGNRFIIKLYDSGHNLILTLPAGTGETNYTPTAIGTYYVTITAGNDGCGDAAASAERRFTVYPFPQPSFIYVADKDYNISFTNTTPNAGNIPSSSINYVWNFGDGSQNETSYTPNSHRFDYAKSPFTVTLTATTPGTTCSQVTVQTINVKFLGNLFLPNAFMPASSNSQLKTYMAKGFGMKTWKMQIFNNFGQLVWQTTKLDNNGAPVEGWDGTYKGQIVQQGVYIWQITATLLNGEDWKGMSYNNSSPSRTGAIHLIR